MTRPASFIAALAAACSMACSLALDWREFVPEGSDITVSFPCRPDRHARVVTVAAMKVQMEMLACSAAGTTFALAFFDVPDPVRVGPTLVDLRATAALNLQAAPQNAPVQIKGMTPNEQAARVTLIGRLRDGSIVQEHAAFFTRGLRIYQATVIGSQPKPQVVDAFISALKLPG